MQLDLWKGAVPVIFTLAQTDIVGTIYPEPLVRMVPRFSLLGALLPTLCEHFDEAAGFPPSNAQDILAYVVPNDNTISTSPSAGVVSSIPPTLSATSVPTAPSVATSSTGALDRIWLQGPDGSALKWWFPAGPLFDTVLEASALRMLSKSYCPTVRQMGSLSPPIYITVRYSAAPLPVGSPTSAVVTSSSPPTLLPRPPTLLPISSVVSIRNQFLYSLKEAMSMLYGNADAIMQLGTADRDRLVNAMFSSEPQQWQLVMNSLANIVSFRDKVRQNRDDEIRRAEEMLGMKQPGPQPNLFPVASSPVRPNVLVTTTEAKQELARAQEQSADLTSFLGGGENDEEMNKLHDFSRSMSNVSSASSNYEEAVEMVPFKYVEELDPAMFTPARSLYLTEVYDKARSYHSLPIRVFLVGTNHLYKVSAPESEANVESNSSADHSASENSLSRNTAAMNVRNDDDVALAPEVCIFGCIFGCAFGCVFGCYSVRFSPLLFIYDISPS